MKIEISEKINKVLAEQTYEELRNLLARLSDSVLIYAFVLSFGFSLICVWKKISAVHFGTGPQSYLLYKNHQFSNFLRALLQIQIYVSKLTLKFSKIILFLLMLVHFLCQAHNRIF